MGGMELLLGGLLGRRVDGEGRVDGSAVSLTFRVLLWLCRLALVRSVQREDGYQGSRLCFS
jgi:hypothetical protein